jgi:hypothetical protein
MVALIGIDIFNLVVVGRPGRPAPISLDTIGNCMIRAIALRESSNYPPWRVSSEPAVVPEGDTQAAGVRERLIEAASE